MIFNKPPIREVIEKDGVLIPAYHMSSGPWMHPDTEENYRKNLKKQPKDWYYRDKEIYYNVNSFGYRTKEFNELDWENSLVIFGDSCVFGVGVSEEDTVAKQLEKLTGIKTINLGTPGASLTFTMHNMVMLLQSFPRPKYVVNSLCPPQRTVLYGNTELWNLGSWSNDKYSDFILDWNRDPYNVQTQMMLTLKTMRELWKDKTSYCVLNYDIKYLKDECVYIHQIDFARDVYLDENKIVVAHPGVETHMNAAYRIARFFDLPRA